MKFATSSGNGRTQMRERQRRDRAATAALRQKFPEFSTLRFQLGFHDNGPFPPAPQVSVMHPPANAYFLFPCPYSDCDGEFDLTPAVTAMAKEQGSQCDGKMGCSGHRAVDKKTKSPCALTMEFRVDAQRGE